MTVVADTSPIHYAVKIDIADVFFRLYGRIAVPSAVHAELLDPGAPDGLRNWVAGNRSRVDVISVKTSNDPGLLQLDPGEREAIALAHQSPDSLLIIDHLEGRVEAERRGIRVTGLLGVIRDAGLRGYLDFDKAIDRLKTIDFRLSPAVETLIRTQFRTSGI